MDDFPGILARDFGFKPQGKSAPMAPPRNNNNSSSGSFSSVNFGLGSGGSVNSRSFSASTKSAPIFDDHDHGGDSDGLLFNDVFGGPPKYSESRGGGGVTASSSSAFDYDSIFKDQNAKSASLPVFDKPVYDDDIFDGLPGLKSSSSGARSTKFDDVFTTIGTPASPKHKAHNNSSPFDNLLGNLGKKEAQSKRETAKVEKDSAVFDDLLPGFGRSSSPSITRSTSESSWAQKPSTNSAKTASSVMDDPFVVLESTSTPAPSSAGLFTDPLEEISKFSSSRSTKVDSSSVNRGAFDDIDAFDNLGKSVPPVSAGINKRGKNMSPLRTGSSIGGTYSPSNKEPVDKYAVDEAEGHSQKMPNDDFQESHETLFDMPTASSEFHRSTGQNVSSPSYVNASPSEANSPPRSEDISESSDDIWLTVSEVPLYTQPTSASPPSRPPPPRPPRTSKLETGSFSSSNSRKNFNEYSFSNSNSSSQSPGSNRAVRSSVPSQIDELEDFAMGRTQNNTNEHVDVLYREDVDVNASSAAAYAAAMKEAMDKAEAKFRQMREKEYLKATRSREAGQPDRDILEAQQRELRERQERLDCERQQRGREEEERELKRLEKERERAREIEREREENEREQRRLERERERAREIEREREKARQAVERATREARERAAAEARTKAERAAVGKATAEARERAGRAAAQRVQAEARERAAAEARERAENAAAEARERANAEAREREVQERAAVSRAEADARQRAERAAVERAAAEARERASAEARERAAAAARANEQRNENDLESFFSSRPSSAPRPRANSSDPFFDTQNKGGSETARRTSVGTTSNMKKASSTTNIVDDLSSIFGATGASGEFQEVEGETEERRRARLERHQRTQERAAKALAEKNQRDLQAQREQAERHRIAETLDVEIKRWAAGKEGNLRALLSTLQYVLWPECGWQPVSLTDLITAAAVKKVYRKATLCIHPDKVQQKGANLQQKYIAEKVFDLLKEAWNKFNSEELF